MIEAEVLTIWETGATPASLRPALPEGTTMEDTTRSGPDTNTPIPVLGQHVVVKVRVPDLTHLNGYVVLWNKPIVQEPMI